VQVQQDLQLYPRGFSGCLLRAFQRVGKVWICGHRLRISGYNLRFGRFLGLELKTLVRNLQTLCIRESVSKLIRYGLVVIEPSSSKFAFKSVPPRSAHRPVLYLKSTCKTLGRNLVVFPPRRRHHSLLRLSHEIA
jgi:hypothetical protein